MGVDLVYLWVDGADPVWRAKRDGFLSGLLRDRGECCSDGRFFDNDELRYSLRSVEQHAPWINHIYIVTDSQRPAWLNADHPKITIIDHSQILPKSALPTFNSVVIELGLVNIEGLSEYFIVANDDTLFARNVDPDDFVGCDGRLKCRFNNRSLTKAELQTTYGSQIDHANRVISEDFALYLNNQQPHHNMDIYSKSVVRELQQRYSAWVEKTLTHRFRDPSDLQRHIYSLYAVATERAEAISIRGYIYLKALKRLVRPLTGVDSMLLNLPITLLDRLKLWLYNPAMICINDNEFATPGDRVAAKRLLRQLYPNKSSFELTSSGDL